ncbi:uncharacterized protein [Argopecten irradians]
MVITSDIRDAGTTAHVYCSISGTSGYQANISLGTNHTRGAVQYVTANLTLGVPHTLRIWHDNTGDAPDWRLERIVLINHRTWNQFMFVGKRWLSAYDKLTQIIPAKGHLYIPGIREDSFFVRTDNYNMNITVADTMGRATVKMRSDSRSGQTDSVRITIETEHVFMGKDKFAIQITHQKRVSETCSHTSNCWCNPKMQQNISRDDVLSKQEEIKQELTVDKKKTSANIRRYISAPDDRKSSQAIGSVGAILLAVPIVLILLSDVLNVLKTKKKRRPVKYFLAKSRSSPKHHPPPEYTVTEEKDDVFLGQELEWHYACGSSTQTVIDGPSAQISPGSPSPVSTADESPSFVRHPTDC